MRRRGWMTWAVLLLLRVWSGAAILPPGARPVIPPSTTVSNCPTCPSVAVPPHCDYIPARLASPGTTASVASAAAATAYIQPSLYQQAAAVLTGRRLLAPARRAVSRAPARRAAPAPSSRKSAPSQKKGRGEKRRHQLEFHPPNAELETKTRELLRELAARPLRCGTWTAECARNYLLHNNTAKVPQAGSVGQRDPLLTVVKDGLEKGMSALPADWEATGFFPEAKQGALGTCAVVATGDNLMQSPLRGEEIDAHDTVIRYNSPMKGYEQGLGTRSSILYWKVRKNEIHYGVEGQKADRFIMLKDEGKFWLFGDAEGFRTNTFRGTKLLWHTPIPLRLVGDMYHDYKAQRKTPLGSPSGGVKLMITMLTSGLCTRVDVYGFTAGGTSKYWNPDGKSMNLVHIIGLEHWLMRLAMEEGLACIYE